MGKHVDYYVSLISPWTYLGAARFEAMVKKHGATVTIWPVDFGAIFPATGGLPLPKRSPQRQAYRMMELRRWRALLDVPLTLQPKAFPTNELPAVCCVIALREQGRGDEAIRLAHAVLRAVWAEERNPADPATLAAIISEVGIDATKLMAASGTHAVVVRRDADTQAAIDRGVFGAPSYVIDDEIFWGQDRLDFVERKLAG